MLDIVVVHALDHSLIQLTICTSESKDIALIVKLGDDRIKELEELVRRGEQKLDGAKQENEKLNKIVGKHRERWDKLKEGAKTRRAEGRSSDNQSKPSTPIPNSKTPDTPLSPHPDSDSNGRAATYTRTNKGAEGTN